MADHAPSINLLPNKNQGFVNQFLTWTLSIGRLLIILVEMLALGTFLYRFNLDMQIIDLHDKIEAQSFIISNFSSAEENFRDLQDRLSAIKQYDELNTRTATIFSDITAMANGQMTFQTLTVETNTATIVAQAYNATTLSTFVEKLKEHPSIESVSINKVENNTSAATIIVTMTAKLTPANFVTLDNAEASTTLNQEGSGL